MNGDVIDGETFAAASRLENELALLKIENANLKANVEQLKEVIRAQDNLIQIYWQLTENIKKGSSDERLQ